MINIKQKTTCVFILVLISLLVHADARILRRSRSKSSLNYIERIKQNRQKFNKIRFPVSPVITQEGDSVILRCDIAGSPSPTIHWLYNRQQVTQMEGYPNSYAAEEPSYEDLENADSTSRLGLTTTAGQIKLDCMEPQHSGRYSCVAENEYHKEVIDTNVLVLPNQEISKPTCNNDVGAIEGALKPFIYMWTVNRIELEGVAVQLFCRARGLPAPQISWYFVGRRGNYTVTTGRNFIILDTGDLVIRDLKWSIHMGRFYCTAENNLGSDTRHAFVYPTKL